MILHIPFHWLNDDLAGFADIALEVDHAPRNEGEIEAVKQRIGTRHNLAPQLITLFAWSVMSE